MLAACAQTEFLDGGDAAQRATGASAVRDERVQTGRIQGAQRGARMAGKTGRTSELKVDAAMFHWHRQGGKCGVLTQTLRLSRDGGPAWRYICPPRPTSHTVTHARTYA